MLQAMHHAQTWQAAHLRAKPLLEQRVDGVRHLVVRAVARGADAVVRHRRHPPLEPPRRPVLDPRILCTCIGQAAAFQDASTIIAWCSIVATALLQ